MGCWSAENAIKAYLQALKMGKRREEPDVAEFISALAAGNNSQLMVIASRSIPAESTLISLVAAAHQTSGRVVCILPSFPNTRDSLGPYADCVTFVVGDARKLLLKDYRGADFVLTDCHMDDTKGIFGACAKHGKGIVVGYNALHEGSWSSEFETHLLPIGDGLLVTRLGKFPQRGSRGCNKKRSRWVTTFDKCTGEEHVFRLTSSQ